MLWAQLMQWNCETQLEYIKAGAWASAAYVCLSSTQKHLSSWEMKIQICMEPKTHKLKCLFIVQCVCRTIWRDAFWWQIQLFPEAKTMNGLCLFYILSIIIIMSQFYSMPFITSDFQLPLHSNIFINAPKHLDKSNMNTPFAWPISNYNNNEM